MATTDPPGPLSPLSRRQALRAALALGAGAVLARCAPAETPTPQAPPTPQPAPSFSMTEPIPPTVVRLPRTETPTPATYGEDYAPTGGHIITSLCLRDGACVVVCPVQCIVPGRPEAEWPRMYVDTDTCIDCGACIPECPWEAPFPLDDVPVAYVARAGQRLNAPGDPAYQERATQRYQGQDHQGQPVILDRTVILREGEVVNLRADIAANGAFFRRGPGYNARNP